MMDEYTIMRRQITALKRELRRTRLIVDKDRVKAMIEQLVKQLTNKS